MPPKRNRSPVILPQDEKRCLPSAVRTLLAEIRRSLAKATDLKQIKNLHDQAEELLLRARRSGMSAALFNQVAEVSFLVKRKGGEMLAVLKLHGGDRKSLQGKYPRLETWGISQAQSRKWQLEAAVSQKDLVDYIRQASRHGKLATSNGLLRLARARAEAAGLAGSGTDLLRDLSRSLQEFERQGRRFAGIYVDPPWPGGHNPRAAISRFAKQLAALPLKSVVARQAHLHLWVPASPECGLKLLRAWGFHCEATLVRTKVPPSFGPYWQQAHETLLSGVRGGLAFRDNSLPSWIEGRPGRGHDGAEEIYARIERVSPSPYLDLFGSRPVSNDWTILGPAQE